MVTRSSILTGDRFGCDESRPQGKDALPSGSTEMNVAVRHTDFATAETVRPSDRKSATAPRKARPVKHPRSDEEFFVDIEMRFSKTLAYLAK